MTKCLAGRDNWLCCNRQLLQRWLPPKRPLLSALASAEPEGENPSNYFFVPSIAFGVVLLSSL